MEGTSKVDSMLIAELKLVSFHAPTKGQAAQPPKKPRVNKLQEDANPPESQTGSPQIPPNSLQRVRVRKVREVKERPQKEGLKGSHRPRADRRMLHRFHQLQRLQP